MPTTFLFDPRVLDDCVSDSAPNVEIAGEAAAYFTLPNREKANYAFYVESIRPDRIPSSLLEISRTEREAPRILRLNYRKANILFLPASVGETSSDFLKQHTTEILKECEILYVRGKFLKGDAETFKNYGVKIL